MYKRIHIYDLDGVLVDSTHRFRLLPNGEPDIDYWFANHTSENILKDKILPMVKQFRADCLDPDIYTIVLSVRTAHPADYAFIVSYLGEPQDIFLVGESGPPVILAHLHKIKLLRKVLQVKKLCDLPVKFFEDNLRTIAAVQEALQIECVYVQSSQGK